MVGGFFNRYEYKIRHSVLRERASRAQVALKTCSDTKPRFGMAKVQVIAVTRVAEINKVFAVTTLPSCFLFWYPPRKLSEQANRLKFGGGLAVGQF